MTTGLRLTGDFCWINMLTPNPEAARAFFSGLLRWNYTEMPGIGHAVQVGGKDIGGLFDVESPGRPTSRPMIGVMVKVSSADDTAAMVKTLGGRAEQPFDIMDAGRMAVARDRTARRSGHGIPKKMNGTEADSALHGAPSWFETLTDDVPRAKRFYEALFGWTGETRSITGVDYTTFALDGPPIAGMMQFTPEMQVKRPHWGVYFTVDNADTAAAEARRLGGEVCVPPKDIPEVGRFAGLVSPQGVVFYVIQYLRR